VDLLVVFSVAGTLLACLSLAFGKDVNWDLQNYHAYAPWALLHGGFDRDVLAGNYQAYMNPAILLVRYAVVSALPPAPAGAALAVVQALNIPILYAITSRLLADEARGVRMALAGLAAALGGLSAVFVSLVGTSFTDSLVSIPILGAVFLLLPTGDVSAPQLSTGRMACAGATMGLAVGLKLTNGFLAVAFAVAVVVGWTSWRQRLRAVFAAGLGGVAGAAATALPWALRMQREFGNPLFPLFGIGETSVEATRFLRFLPAGLLDAASYPLKWAMGVRATAELPFTDIRPALLLGSLALALCGALIVGGRSLSGREPARVGQRRLATFLASGAALWISTSAIHRHGIALDLLVGPGIVLGLRRSLAARPAILASAVCVGAALATIRPPDWGRTSWSHSWFEVELPAALRAPATYVLLPRSGTPLGFLAPSFPEGSIFVQSSFARFVPPGSRLDRRARGILAGAAPERAFLMLAPAPAHPPQRVAQDLGLGLAVPCHPIRTAVRAMAACPLVRVVRPADDEAPLLPVGEWFQPGWPGDGSLLLGDGWSYAEAWGRWAIGPRSTVRFRPGGTVSGPSVLELVGRGFVGPGIPALEIGVFVDGRHATDWHLAGKRDAADAERTVCLPSGWNRGPLSLELRADMPRSPASVGQGADERPLTFGLRRLRVRAATGDECPA